MFYTTVTVGKKHITNEIISYSSERISEVKFKHILR